MAPPLAPDGAHALTSIADQLERLADHVREASGNDAPEPPLFPARGSRETCLETARRLYDNRRRRSAIFGNHELFGEPAWDILLDLYIAHAGGEQVSVSSACIGAAVPSTTALRWLGILQDAGLVLRDHDAHDLRRILVRLSPDAIERMERFFRETEGACTAPTKLRQA